jgi:hypothetical protein
VVTKGSRQTFVVVRELAPELDGIVGELELADKAGLVEHRAAIGRRKNRLHRNPDVEQIRVVLARPDGAWSSLGGTKVSTGQAGRRDYYLTPTGVFLHTDLILGWRAEGTFNPQHIRGLGLKGMRVWDFGWQRATKGWETRKEGDIRLLLHATDPDYLERRLGRPASKGLRAHPGDDEQVSRSPRHTRRGLRASCEGRPPI